MNTLPLRLHTVFRVGASMCFIGHGAFGIMTKAVWCNYFAVFGIGPELAYRLMPFIGMADILFGISLLIYPTRAVAAWLVFWGLFTALLRPLSGEPIAECIERAGNYSLPLMWLLLIGVEGLTPRDWFRKMEAPNMLEPRQWDTLFLGLRITSFALLFGHGWLNSMEKGALLQQYASLGFPDTTLAARAIGGIEIVGSLLILFKPLRPVILTLLIWKMVSESFYPVHGLFEWIERGGSYGILLGLWFASKAEYQRAATDPSAVKKDPEVYHVSGSNNNKPL